MSNEQKRGPGRPRKKPTEKRTRNLTVVLTEQEWQEVKEAASVEGRPASQWCRRVLLAALERKKRRGE